MKRHSGLFEQIVAFRNLLLAARTAARGKREQASVAQFEFYLEWELLQLQEELVHGQYQPGAFFTFEVHDPKRRRICAAPYRDRVLHHAIAHIIEPLLDRRLIFDTYACRLDKGTHAAIRRAQYFARHHRYFLKFDIHKFFDSVDHGILAQRLRRIIKDRALLRLLDRIIEHAPPDQSLGKGLPIGNLTSQHFANAYLGVLDQYIKNQLCIRGYLRYMDDHLVFGDDKEQLHEQLVQIKVFLHQELQLTLKERATVIAPVTEGIGFLGVRIYPGVIRLNARSLRRFRRQVQAREQAYQAGFLDEKSLIESVGSLYAHVSHANTLHLRQQMVKASLG